MFGVGMPELVVIMVVALIVLGPKRLPEAARGIGKILGEFRRATSGIGEELENARLLLEIEARKAAEAAESPSASRSAAPPVTDPEPPQPLPGTEPAGPASAPR